MIGERVRDARTSAGLTLRELGLRAGVSHTYLGDIEKGHRAPSARTAAHIAVVLGLDVDVLLASMGKVSGAVSAFLMADPEAAVAQLHRMVGDHEPAVGSAGPSGTATAAIA